MRSEAATRTLALLPGLGSSLSDFARHGQLERLVGWYLPAYLERFDRVRFFTYEPEELLEFVEDAELRRRVELVAPTQKLPRHVRAFGLAAGNERELLRSCAVARVLHAPGALPAALTGVTYACTYGYSYPDFSRVTVPGPVAAPALALKRAAMRQSLRLLVRRAAAVIVTTPVGEAEARRLGASRIVTIPNGVDVRMFAPNGGARRYDVAFVGQLVARKDVATLLAALAFLGRDLKVAVVGDGPMRGELEAAAARAGIDVDFVGVLPNAAVADLLRQTRLFVLPSRDEGHPKALLEGMASGLACIGSDVRGIREIGADGAVRLFPPGDERKLAHEVARLLDDDVLAEQLGARARVRVVEEFDLARLLKRETDLLFCLA